jgi:hypothetical protein
MVAWIPSIITTSGIFLSTGLKFAEHKLPYEINKLLSAQGDGVAYLDYHLGDFELAK